VTPVAIPAVPLGASGIKVSRLALGSWRTYERISRAQGIRVMQAAREAGITFLDDARYNDETGSAPMPTGHSEVIFGELFRGSGWRRDDAVVSNKLWWEFWPDESPNRSWRPWPARRPRSGAARHRLHAAQPGGDHRAVRGDATRAGHREYGRARGRGHADPG
jgi:aryl-alcohol dehydrogenase-like predicted oxidoreductase